MPFLGHPFRLAAWAGASLSMAHVTWHYIYSPGEGSGPSMLPTFRIQNDWFIISKRYRRGRGVQVGDCVSYSIPVEPGQEGLKRVIGMPGDYVLVNSPDAGNDNMIQVPKGHCYIVGDNLPWSRDSRDYGPLPLALIKGKLVSRAEINGFNPMKWFTPMPKGLVSVKPPSSPKTER